MTNLTSEQLRYLQEVLGVEQIMWRSPKANELTPRQKEAYIFVDPLDNDQKTLLHKMLEAMKLSDFEVIENPSREDLAKHLKDEPKLALVFGQTLAEKLQLDFTKRGKFLDVNGVATIVTYGPSDLFQQPELKSEAWKDMKHAMVRLT